MTSECDLGAKKWIKHRNNVRNVFRDIKLPLGIITIWDIGMAYFGHFGKKSKKIGCRHVLGWVKKNSQMTFLEKIRRLPKKSSENLSPPRGGEG